MAIAGRPLGLAQELGVAAGADGVPFIGGPGDLRGGVGGFALAVPGDEDQVPVYEAALGVAVQVELLGDFQQFLFCQEFGFEKVGVGGEGDEVFEDALFGVVAFQVADGAFHAIHAGFVQLCGTAQGGDLLAVLRDEPAVFGDLTAVVFSDDRQLFHRGAEVLHVLGQGEELFP